MSASGLYEYTLMPTRMTSRFSIKELSDLTLSDPFEFSKGLKLLRVRPKVSDNNDPLEVQGMSFEDVISLLFDISKDPDQKIELDKPEVINYLLTEMSELMKKADAPQELFERLKLNIN